MMDKGQLENIATEVVNRIIQKYPQLDVQIDFIPSPNRSHTYHRQIRVGVLGKDEYMTYQLHDLYAPPRTLEAVIAIEIEALTQLYVHQFIEGVRAKLKRTAIKA